MYEKRARAMALVRQNFVHVTITIRGISQGNRECKQVYSKQTEVIEDLLRVGRPAL